MRVFKAVGLTVIGAGLMVASFFGLPAVASAPELPANPVPAATSAPVPTDGATDGTDEAPEATPEYNPTASVVPTDLPPVDRHVSLIAIGIAAGVSLLAALLVLLKR